MSSNYSMNNHQVSLVELQKIKRIIDIEVIIKDEENFGLGIIDTADQIHIVKFQDYINLNLENDDTIYDELCEGTSYAWEEETYLEAINNILEFWFIEPINSEEDILIPVVDSYKYAIDNFDKFKNKIRPEVLIFRRS